MKNDWPKISVVTPSYNQGIFLERTILSVLNQNYPNLEYIIIDGASADNSVETIQMYENNLFYWESEKDNGFGHAINKGFARATGEILCWLNSDDLLLPGSLSAVGLYFQEHNDVDLVFGDRFVLDKNDNFLYCRRYYCFFTRQFKYGKTLPQEATFWRREAFIKAGGYLDEKLTFAIDFDLWCRMSKHATIHHIPIPLGAFRVHSNSKSSTMSSQGITERTMIVKKYYGRYPVIIEMKIFQLYLGIVRRLIKVFRWVKVWKKTDQYFPL